MLSPLVARQAVHDDDVAPPEFRHENLGDIGLEGGAVDRSVEHPGRNEAAKGQRANEGRCLPVAMRNPDPKPLTAPAATVPTGHVRGGPGLVDEDEALRIEVELAIEPGLASPQDVRAVLLRGVGRLFFARDRVAFEEALDRAEAKDQTLLVAQNGAHFIDRPVTLGTESRKDRVLVGVDVMGSLVSAHGFRTGVPLLALQRAPAADARRAYGNACRRHDATALRRPRPEPFDEDPTKAKLPSLLASAQQKA